MESVSLIVGSGPSSSVSIDITDSNLSTLFQPIVHLGNSRKDIFGYEALTRGPANTPVEDPTEMFLAAYDQGNLLDVDMICFRKTILHCKNFPPGIKLFVNIHPHTLGKSTKISAEILDIIKSAGLNPEQFVLELVEQFPVRNHDMYMGNVMYLRKGGMNIGLDDVGAGYSDFYILSKLRPDFLKVNGYFADHIQINTIKQKVVKAILDLSIDIKAKVIVEGIERTEDLDVVESMGAHMGQGYYFSPPMAFGTLKFRA